MSPKDSGPDHVTLWCSPGAAHLATLQLAVVNPKSVVLVTTHMWPSILQHRVCLRDSGPVPPNLPDVLVSPNHKMILLLFQNCNLILGIIM